MYKCPECGSTKIDQYRMPFGEMWCITCGFRIEDKNKIPNPFVETAKRAARQADSADRAKAAENNDANGG